MGLWACGPFLFYRGNVGKWYHYVESLPGTYIRRKTGQGNPKKQFLVSSTVWAVWAVCSPSFALHFLVGKFLYMFHILA
jgi:hypothetical protein